MLIALLERFYYYQQKIHLKGNFIIGNKQGF